MITREVIQRTTEYRPSLRLDETQLLVHLQKQLQYTCSKHTGFILEVIRVTQIHSRKISIYNGNIIVDCSIEVDRLLPEVGQRIQGVVKQTYPQGLIIIVCNCMRVFLPCSGHQTVKPDDYVDFEITQIRFQKGKYDCIGTPNPSNPGKSFTTPAAGRTLRL
jgi:DNA-directed RNA polymerase subunit E'/Rpb7